MNHHDDPLAFAKGMKNALAIEGIAFAALIAVWIGYWAALP